MDLAQRQACAHHRRRPRRLRRRHSGWLRSHPLLTRWPYGDIFSGRMRGMSLVHIGYGVPLRGVPRHNDGPVTSIADLRGGGPRPDQLIHQCLASRREATVHPPVEGLPSRRGRNVCSCSVTRWLPEPDSIIHT